MRVRDQIDGYLREIGSRLGFPLALDGNDTCSLVCDDDLQCNVTVPDDGELILLHAPVMPVPPDRQLPLFERALTMNLYAGETEGCSLAYDPALRGLVLGLVVPAVNLDAGAFGNLLGNFIQTAQRIAVALECDERGLGASAAANSESAGQQNSEILGDMLQNLHRRA